MRRFQVLPMATLIVVAALSEPGHLLAQEASRPLPVPTAVTLGFEGEGLPYGDKGLTPEEIRDTFGPATQILCVAYSADGKTLAVGDGPTREICAFPGPPLMNENGGLIRLVDTATHRVRVVLGPTKVRQHEYEVHCLTFSAEGKVLVAAGLEDYVVDGAARLRFEFHGLGREHRDGTRIASRGRRMIGGSDPPSRRTPGFSPQLPSESW